MIAGLIAGGIFILEWALFHFVYVAGKEEFDFGSGEVLGYLTMLIALSTVYFGVKRLRDQELGGQITFGKAFSSGLIIVVIASLIYTVSWTIYAANFLPDFADQYFAGEVEALRASGMEAGELEEKLRELESFKESYENPFFRFAIN